MARRRFGTEFYLREDICTSCTSKVRHIEPEAIPMPDDEEAWKELALEHRANCRWVYGRAGQL